MRPLRPSKKMDIKFVAGAIAATALICGLSLYSDAHKKNTLEISNLPDTSDPNYSKLVINEIVTGNSGIWVNKDNIATDFVELYNSTDHSINLEGYGLSDRMDKLKWVFPNVTIDANSYLTVSLGGYETDGLVANFKLGSKGGETLILTNGRRKIIDAVDTLALEKDTSMIRDDNGNWHISSYVTPGYENSQKGLEEYISSISETDISQEIVINEFLTKNKGNYLNECQNSDGFIELMNVSDHSVNLAEYCLSDDLYVPYRKQLDNVVLSPNEICTLNLGEGDVLHQDYTGFKLSTESGNVVLSKNGRIVQNIEYSNLKSGKAYSLIEGRYQITSLVSPGYPNDADGIAAFQKEYLANKNDLIINEVMNQNNRYLVQNGNNYYDWIELYNNSDHDIYLGDYCLSTDINHLDKYHLPDVTISRGSMIVLMCSGEEILSNQSYDHTNFKLGDSEGIYLSRNNELVDTMYIADVPYGFSYGRNNSHGYFYIPEPTPNGPNHDGYRCISLTPEFSVAGGVYNGISRIELELIGPGMIRYTVDGTEPTNSSELYNGPIVLDKTTVIKAKCYQEDMKASPSVTETYIINENHTIPVMSVSLDPDEFRYLNANPWVEGLEYQAYAELYEEDGHFSIPCSISLFGGNARGQVKKNYCIRFDSEWGASELHYPVFDQNDNSVYDALVLRAGSTDWNVAMIRDIVGTSLVGEYTDVEVQAYKPVIVYFNGNYWGIFNLREKVNGNFIVEHKNVSRESVNIFRIDYEVETGSRSAYDNLRSYCRSHDLTNPEYYQYVADRFNLTDLADYWIAEGYFTNNDLLNVRMYSSSEYDEGKYHYIFYDLDYAWYRSFANWYTEYIGHAGGMTNHNYENDIVYALLKNSDFRKLWLDRLEYNLNNTFRTETVINRIDEIVDYYMPEMERDRTRWNVTMEDWLTEVEKLRQYARDRMPVYLRTTKSYFNLSESEMQERFGELY